MPQRLSSLRGKTYLITGATSGTGFQTARILLSKGAQVVMLNRNNAKSEATKAALLEEFGDKALISFVQMDLSDLSSVRQAAKKLLDTVPKIEALICNAAIAQVPKRKRTKEGFESQLGTNHYGHFLLSGLLFERIAKSKGRIVVVASLGYNLGLKTIQFDDLNWDKKYNPNSAYSQSKLAQMMFAYELQDRLTSSDKKVEVYVCHPGSSATSLITTSGNLMTRFIFWLMTKTPIVQSAHKGAYPAVMCATETGLAQRALYGPTGTLGFVGPVGTCNLNAHAYQKDTMAKLWDVSEEATGFHWSL
ncbi:MAG: SDR family oxidoreductase [Candidatus Puniceispirillaceae bacterium]